MTARAVRSTPQPTASTPGAGVSQAHVRGRAGGFLTRAATVSAVLAALLLPQVANGGHAHAAPAAATTGSSESPVDPEASVTWTVAPADDVGADARISLRHSIDPGATVTDHVAVTNFSPRSVVFDVYASDGMVTEDGAFDLVPPEESSSTGSGAWIQIEPTEGATPRDGGGVRIEIPSETTRVLPISISVPPSATPGDHPAGIVAELASDPDAQVQMVSRVGVRAHLRVTGDLAPALAPAVEDVRWTPSWNPFAAGTLTVTYSVVNAGNVRLGSAEALSNSGLWGIGRSTEDLTHDEILPGQSVTETAELATWPTFRSSGTLTAAPSVVGTDEIPVELQSAQADYSAWTLPLPQLGLLAVVIGALLLLRRGRRRRALAVEDRIQRAVEEATLTVRGTENV